MKFGRVRVVPCCGTYLTLSPDWKRCSGPLGLTAFAFTLMFAYVNWPPIALCAMVAVGVAVCVILMFLTVLTDPGVLPPLIDVRNEGKKAATASDTGEEQKHNYLLRDSTYLENFMLSYCSTCRHLRPKLTSHCRKCDVCVQGHDHHCTNLGCCVGQRNHKYFLSFLLCVSLTSALVAFEVILPSFGKVVRSHSGLATTVLVHLLLLVMSTTSFGLLGFFFLYYVMLCVRGSTSRQFLTNRESAEKPSLCQRLCPPRSLIPAYVSALSDPQERHELVAVGEGTAEAA